MASNTPSRSALRLRDDFAAFPPTITTSADFSLRLSTVALSDARRDLPR